MDRIDLDELERLFDEDIDMDGEKLEAFGTQVMLSDDSKYAHAFAKNDNFWLASVRARLIAATINAVPDLIARVRELELTVKYMHREYIEDASDCDHVGLACPHRVGKWWCGADEEEHIKCHTRAAIKYAKEAGECL